MLHRLRLLCAVLVFVAPAALAQEADVMRAGPLDNGKMWLFENPPVDYLAETYDFRPDAAWFERARLAALRMPGCSASFVSSDGLIATNHHCARSAIVDVSGPGERLADVGFFAQSLAEERAVPGLYVDQLVEITDVTERVEAAVAAAETDAERAEARRAAVETIEAERTAGEEGMTVQVVSLYNGGKYSAYTFRRYDDLRLVAAPETQLGFFGGDADNFTYPRYALDFTFLRAYDADGKPLDTSDFYFPWSTEGTEPGDLIFVIGNPGSTDRGDTMAQLEWRRDVQIPGMLEYLGGRIAALDVYLAAHPDDAAVRNQRFSLSNAFKGVHGTAGRARERDHHLAPPRLRAPVPRRHRRRPGAPRGVRRPLRPDGRPSAEKREIGADFGAFAGLTNTRYGSAPLLRGYLVAQLLGAQQAGADDAVAELRETIASIGDKPGDIDERYLAAQLRQFERFLPPCSREPDPARTDARRSGRRDRRGLGARDRPRARSRRSRPARSAPDDPAVALALAVAPRYADYQSANAALGEQESEIARRLGQARFAVYGTAVPPDATFSPRFTDGVVRPYEYNGTVAPPYTTLFGLYDRNASFGQDSEWALPDTWLPAPPDLDRSTPLNFVSTSDTIGGNSGSPAVDRDLRLVGLNFDRTIEGLSRDYIYFADRGRNVMVDARAVIEALDTVYDLDRVVQELRTGDLVETEAEADAMP